MITPLTDGQNNVIVYLNNMGFPVLQILDRFYTVNTFEEGGTTLPKHSLSGKEITGMMTIYQDIQALDTSKKDEIYNKVINQKLVTKYFHKDIQWVLHFS